MPWSGRHAPAEHQAARALAGRGRELDREAVRSLAGVSITSSPGARAARAARAGPPGPGSGQQHQRGARAAWRAAAAVRSLGGGMVRRGRNVHGSQGPYPPDPGFSQAGHPVLRHLDAAGAWRGLARDRRPGGRRRASLPARRAGRHRIARLHLRRRRSPTSSASASPWCARSASCRARWSATPTTSSMAATRCRWPRA